MNTCESCSLAIIGDGSVGKSSIIAAFRTEGFSKVYRQTVGCDFYEKSLQVRGDLHVSMKVWDIGGQSIHSKNLDKYIGNSKAIFLVYDVTNAESFANMNDWLLKVREHSSSKILYLIGNKVDLISLRQITENDHNKFIEKNDLKGGIFLSAKSGDNVIKVFYQIAAESVGIKLTAYELGFHDKVVKAFVEKSDIDPSDGRTAFADAIEEEDLEAERRKISETSSGGCQCICF